MLLAERFKVVRRLGEGSSGVVYEAFDREARRRVAIKVLRADGIGGELKREFRALQDIAHPNLVMLGELGEHEGSPFYTMDLIDGVDFLTWVREGDEARLRDAFGQLAEGLCALHAAGLVHRDIKAHNVLVRGVDGRVVVLDFGLVTKHSDGDRTAIGTPIYMAPEQYTNGPVGPPADCYAAGVLLYIALGGHPPFTGTQREIAAQKMTHRPPPLGPDAPPDLAVLAHDLIAIEPKTRPTAPTIVERLGRVPTAVVLPTTDTPSPFLGRHHELNRLAAQLAAVRGGATRAVALRGESGIGKTALARQFADQLATGALVLWTRCFERETVPFKAIDGVIEGLTTAIAGTAVELVAEESDAVAQMFPSLGRIIGVTAAPRTSTREVRGRAFAGVRTLLDRVARARTVVVIVDDLQWSDLDSLALMSHVLAAPDPPPLLLIGCIRDDAAATVRDAELRGLGIELADITLGPLEPGTAASLARHVLGREATDPEQIAREAGGHPLFTIALARDASAGASGRTLADVFVERLDRLSDDARRFVEVVCLAHAPLAMETAGAASGVVDTQTVVAALRAAQLVRTSGPRQEDVVEPFHDRVRVAIAERIAVEARGPIHAAIAIALEESGAADPGVADPGVLALHWADAGDRSAASRHAREAADRATDGLAFEHAAELFRWILELDPGAADRSTILACLADALANAGHGGDAAEAYLEAARSGHRAGILMRRRAMQQLFLAGQVPRGWKLLDELAEQLGVPNPRGRRAILVGLVLRRAWLAMRRPRVGNASPRELAQIDFCWDAASGLGLIDAIRGSYFQTVNVLLSMRAGDTSRVVRALMADTVFHAANGPSPRFERLRARCDELAAELGTTGRAWALFARGMSATLLGQWQVAADTLPECVRVLGNLPVRVADEGIATALLLDHTRTMLCGPLLFLGRLRELRRFSSTYLGDAIRRDDLVAATHFRTGSQALLFLANGDLDGALRNADDGIAPWPGFAGHLPAFLDLQARVTIDLYRGAGDAAARRVLAEWATFRHTFLIRVQYVRITLLDLRGRSAVAAAAAASGSEQRRWLADAARCADRLADERAAWAKPLAEIIRAGIAKVRGDDAAATRVLAEAIVAFEAADMALHAELARIVIDRPAALRWMASEAVVAPDRLAAVIVPGLVHG